MIKTREIMTDIFNGVYICETVAVKSSSGKIYYKPGEIILENLNAHKGAVGLLKRAVFTSSDIPIGTVITSFGFYAISANKMFEESNIYEGQYVMTNENLSVDAEIWMGQSAEGMLFSEKSRLLFNMFFYGQNKPIYIEAETSHFGKIKKQLIQEGNSNAMTLRAALPAKTQYCSAHILIEDKPQLSCEMRSHEVQRHPLPIGTKEFEVESLRGRGDRVLKQDFSQISKSDYDLVEYCYELEPYRDDSNCSDYIEEICESQEVAYYDADILTLDKNIVSWYKTTSGDIQKIGTGGILEHDIVQFSSHEKLLFCVTKKKNVVIYGNGVYMLVKQKYDESIFKGATSIHISYAHAPVTVCYQTRDKCIIKDYSYTRNTAFHLMTFVEVSSRTLVEPKIVSSQQSVYKLIIDYKSSTVILVGISGLGLILSSVIKQKILKHMDVRLMGDFIFFSGTQPEIYSLKTGQKVPIPFIGDDHVTMVTSSKMHFARVYLDNSFDLFVFDSMKNEIVTVSTRIQLETRPVRFVVTAKDVFVLAEGRKVHAYRFVRHLGKLKFHVPTTEKLSYEVLSYVPVSQIIEWRFSDVEQPS